MPSRKVTTSSIVAATLIWAAAIGAAVPTSAAPVDSGSAGSGSGGGAPAPPAPPAPGSVRGFWTGSWTSSSGTYPASLDVSQDAPMRAHIDIPERLCRADWHEVRRDGGVIVLDATVTQGTCSNNTWVLTIGGGTITGQDSTDSGTRVNFHRD